MLTEAVESNKRTMYSALVLTGIMVGVENGLVRDGVVNIQTLHQLYSNCAVEPIVDSCRTGDATTQAVQLTALHGLVLHRLIETETISQEELNARILGESLVTLRDDSFKSLARRARLSERDRTYALTKAATLIDKFMAVGAGEEV